VTATTRENAAMSRYDEGSNLTIRRRVSAQNDNVLFVPNRNVPIDRGTLGSWKRTNS